MQRGKPVLLLVGFVAQGLGCTYMALCDESVKIKKKPNTSSLYRPTLNWAYRKPSVIVLGRDG